MKRKIAFNNVDDLIEILKEYKGYDLETFTEVIYKDNALGTEEKQVEVGELIHFDSSLSEKKLTLKFETMVDLQYHDLG